MPRPLLVLDSGLGGLTVLRELRPVLAGQRFVYAADTAAFPYGNQDKDALRAHLLDTVSDLLERFEPSCVVIACNTAATVALDALRARFPGTPFVGTVPAIKPAAERTASGVVAVLATPGTVAREYTRQLIERFAKDIEVRLVGARHLAEAAEAHLRREPLDLERVRAEIAPCFHETERGRTDIVVLACTHYPFLTNVFRRLAPWPVDWVDPAEAIARRVREVAPPQAPSDAPDLAVFTGAAPDEATRRVLRGHGLTTLWPNDALAIPPTRPAPP